MTESKEPPLQFERAEFTAGAPAAGVCSRCHQAIRETYYMVDAQVACEGCRRQAEADRASGSPLARVVRATFFGTLAGALGAGLWYGVRAVTDLEIGLISIVVGVLVGQAVLKGSGGRGGRGYQLLAVALTYGSIVSTYVPMILTELDKAEAADTDTAADGAPVVAQPASASAGPATPAATPARSLVKVVVFSVIVGVIALVAPFLGGLENIIGILIIAFGVWEAWKITRKRTLEITGPHRLAAPAAEVA